MNKTISIEKQYNQSNNDGHLLADLQRTFLNDGEDIAIIKGHNYIIQKCPELFYTVIEITDLKHKLKNLEKASPQTFIELYKQKLIADEIVNSHSLDGITCNHSDILDLVMASGNSNKKHADFVKQYTNIINKQFKVEDQIGLSKLYYDSFITNVRKNEFKNMGVLFRDNKLKTRNEFNTESDIYKAVETTFNYYQHSDETMMIKISLLHYFLEMIKPFATNNGQITRLVTSGLLYPELSLASFKLADSIKTNLEDYEQIISETNSSNNVYDLTAFVYQFLNMILNNIKDTIYDLVQNNKKILQFKSEIKELELTNNQKRCLLAVYEGQTLGLDLTTKQIMHASGLSNPTVLKCTQQLADLGAVSIYKPGKQKIVKYITNNI